MTESQRPAFDKTLVDLANSLVPAVTLKAANLDLYWGGLHDLPYKLFMRGLGLAVKRCRYFPTIADIRASLDIDPELKAELVAIESTKVRDDLSLAAKVAFVAKQLRGPTEPYILSQTMDALADVNQTDLREVLDDLVRTNTFWPSVKELRDYCLMKAESREWNRKQALIAAADQFEADAPADVKAGRQTVSERGLAVLRRMTQPSGMDLFRKTTVCGCGTRVYAERDGAVFEYATSTPHVACLPAAVEAGQPRPPFCGFCEDTGFASMTCSADRLCERCRRKGQAAHGGHSFVRVCECRATNPNYQKHFLAAKEAAERRSAGTRSKALARTHRGQKGWTRAGESDGD